MTRISKALAWSWLLVKNWQLYILVPSLVVVFVIGVAVGHRRWNRDFSDSHLVMERNTGETVYVHRGTPYSNLFHFSDCEYFSDKLYAAGPCWEVFNKGTFKPCPKCARNSVGKDGMVHFFKTDAPPSARHSIFDKPEAMVNQK